MAASIRGCRHPGVRKSPPAKGRLINALFCHAADGAFVGRCVLCGVVACGFVINTFFEGPIAIITTFTFIFMLQFFICRKISNISFTFIAKCPVPFNLYKPTRRINLFKMGFKA